MFQAQIDEVRMSLRASAAALAEGHGESAASHAANAEDSLGLLRSSAVGGAMIAEVKRQETQVRALKEKIAAAMHRERIGMDGPTFPGLGAAPPGDAEDLMLQGSAHLSAARTAAAASETTAQNVLGTLRTQRDGISRTKNYLGEMEENLDSSRNMLGSIDRRIATNKLVLWAIVLLLLVAFVLTVAIKMRARGG